MKQNVASSITRHHLHVWFHDTVCFVRQPLFFLISFQMCFCQFILGSELSLLLLAKEKSQKTDMVSTFFSSLHSKIHQHSTTSRTKCIVNNPRCEPTKLLIVHWSKNCSVTIYPPLKTDNNMAESIKTATQRVMAWYMLQFIRVSPSWRKWFVEAISGLTYFSNASRCNWVYGTQTQKKIYIIINICQFSISNMLLLLFFQTSSRSRHSWCLGCYLGKNWEDEVFHAEQFTKEHVWIRMCNQ